MLEDEEITRIAFLTIILFSIVCLSLGAFIYRLGFDIDAEVLTGIFAAGANLTFVLMLILELKNQEENLKFQRKSLEVDKASKIPDIDHRIAFYENSDTIDLKIYNHGPGKARNIKVLFILVSEEETAIRGYRLGNLEPSSTFVSPQSKNIQDPIEIGRDITFFEFSKNQINKENYYRGIKEFIESTKGPVYIKTYIYFENMLGNVEDNYLMGEFKLKLENDHLSALSITREGYQTVKALQSPEINENTFQKIDGVIETIRRNFDEESDLYREDGFVM